MHEQEAPPNGRLMIGKNKATEIVAEAELLRLVLTGLTLRESANYMRAGYSKIRAMAKKPEFLLKLQEHSGEIAKRLTDELSHTQMEFAKKLEEASEMALEEMIGMMHSMDPGAVKYKICQDLMDRDTRASRTKRIEAATSHEFINPLVLQTAAARAREIEEYDQRKLGGDSINPTDSGNGQS